MKTRFFLTAVLLFVSGLLYSQAKIGYVDSKIIIDGMEDAKDAQTNLDNVVQTWKTEIQHMNDTLNLLKDDFEKKKLILTDNIKKQKQEEIADLE